VYLVEHFNQVDAPKTQATPAPDTQEPDDIDQLPEDQYGDTSVDPAATESAVPPTAAPVSPPKVKGIPEFHGLRGIGYVYVEYETGEKEFYDLSKDPYELNNLAAKLDPATGKTLADRVKTLVSCKAETCRAAEDQPIAVTMPASP